MFHPFFRSERFIPIREMVSMEIKILKTMTARDWIMLLFQK